MWCWMHCCLITPESMSPELILGIPPDRTVLRLEATASYNGGSATAVRDVLVDSNPAVSCNGDFDDDGDVDGSDLAIFATDFGRTDCATGDFCEGDFDGDNDVDGSDLAVFAADFGKMNCLQ